MDDSVVPPQKSGVISHIFRENISREALGEPGQINYVNGMENMNDDHDDYDHDDDDDDDNDNDDEGEEL